jgi:hypothetical protein
MTEPTPSKASVLRNLAIAIVVAVVLLFTLVLPAEFGRDPTGIGGLLGLTKLHAGSAQSAAPALPAQTVALQDVVGGNDALTTQVQVGDGRDPVPLPNPQVHQAQATAPKTETLKIHLGADEKTEIKAQLAKGKMILYSWTVEGGNVYVDFHGHDPSLGDRFWVRYEEADGINGRNGSLVAPFKGEHGWYWLNVSEKPVTITLTVTGYHDKLINYGRLQ